MNQSNKKTALIVGITGQDGAYLALHLLDQGYKVIGTSRDVRRTDLYRLDYLGIRDRVSLCSLDVLNRTWVHDCFERYQPNEIYNLAAQSSVGKSFQRPAETLSYNTNSVLNLLEAIREVDSNIRFYQASSSEMFGNISPEVLPVKEGQIFHPASPYAVSKAAAHWIAVNYREAYGMFVSCGILFNHESVLRGDDYVTRKIMSAAFEMLDGRKAPLLLGNVDVVRDWGYAPKYVEAMWLMLQQPEPSDFLICSGQKCSLRQYVYTVFQRLGLDPDKQVGTDPSLYRAVDLNEMYGNNQKARSQLGWNYSQSIDELIECLIQDERAFRNWNVGRKK
ncbi:MAG: GDPmannose 4,6-dehydratase [Akkermansiaceae bacterium]|jgi:GDPmannose 4,6-dehydratase